jgi:hypothetical protein
MGDKSGCKGTEKEWKMKECENENAFGVCYL